MSSSLDDLGYEESPGIWSAPKRHQGAEPKRTTFYGKYRGSVLANIDPMGMGRLLVRVPDVYGLLPSAWAMPCVPMAGLQQGTFVVPPLNAGVWVEFEQGSPQFPVWVGFYWGSRAELPASGNVATPGMPAFVVETATKSMIAISDTPIPPTMLGPGIALRAGASSIAISAAGVTITAPLITIRGVVNINNGALAVTLQAARVPGYLFHVGASASCFHQAPMATTPAQTKVFVNGLAVATVANQFTVAGCPFIVGTVSQPCLTVKMTMLSTKVLVGGSPAVLQTGTGIGAGICQSAAQAPQGAPTINQMQIKVVGI